MLKGSAAASSDKLAGLDVLRALAALLVLTSHVVGICKWGNPDVMIGIGRTGRRLFLVLSGFLLFLPYARAAYGQGGRVNVATYALKRALRLLPLYVTAVLAFALLGFVRGWAANEKNLLYHLLFIHVYDKSTFFGLAGPLWFMAVIAHWYVLLPLVGWVWLKLKHRLAIWTAATLALTAAHAFVWARPPLPLDAFTRIVDKGFLGALPFLFAAMTAAACFVRARRGAAPSSRVLPITWVPASALLLAALVLFKWQGGQYLGPLGLSAVAFGFAFAPAARRLLAPIRSFGRMSYSVFVWQAPIIIAFSRLSFFWHIEQGALRTALMFAAVLPPVLLVSYVSYHLLEKPFLRPKTALPRRALMRIAVGYACLVLASGALFAAERGRSNGKPEAAVAAHAHAQPARAYSPASR
jgi:peptidoglycan/LPS O-acetylase OafA/YrhL